ncbi:alpha/beta hydrolase [Curvibacter sp. APW13]|uniref:alpha/beta fold hydrolase n=1 Tax=Curvibacter sp. APW13 TaxID=3077236 RepID=UPI0028DF5790|nr:alpha/beta hydrolase [Curvibacter sp. APW13]MDT8989915.1 alpha/beta hydrolase [Curvibacter sp. APW13]
MSLAIPTQTSFQGRYVQVNGITMHVIVEGSGPEVLLLHGFPDTHAIWREQIPALVEAGYRVIAPDLRGCGLTDMPRHVSDYRIGTLVQDVAALLDALGVERVRLVAHDWGAAIGWQFAIQHQHRVVRYAALSVGHLSCYTTAGWMQKLKGYYIALIQLRGFAEWLFTAFDWAFLRFFADAPHEYLHVRAGKSAAGRMTAAMNYYRANLGLLIPRQHGFVNVPVMGVFSTKDRFLVENQMVRSEAYCKAGWRFERLEGVGHWMTSEAPERVNPLLLDFLR